jgi:hypothetical protein
LAFQAGVGPVGLVSYSDRFGKPVNRFNSIMFVKCEKCLAVTPEPILLTQIFAKLTALGHIHPVSTGVEPL